MTGQNLVATSHRLHHQAIIGQESEPADGKTCGQRGLPPTRLGGEDDRAIRDLDGTGVKDPLAELAQH